MTWSVRLLHYGAQEVPGAQVRHQTGWDSWETFDFYVFVLQDGENTVLVDCGMDDPEPLNREIAADMGDRGRIRHLPTGGRVGELLAGVGLATTDVTHVALTHLHADHAGNLEQFPDARVILGRRGWERHRGRRTSHPALVAAPAFPDTVLAALDAAALDGRLLLADDDDDALPGLRVRTIGGHTDDSTAFLVDTATEALLFPGDTIWTYDNLERDIPVGSHVSVPDCLDAMAWARTTGAVIVPSHDPLVRTRYPDGVLAGAA